VNNNIKKVSIIIPVYNEELNLEQLYSRLTKVSQKRDEEFVFLFINDGSSDGSLQKLLEIRKNDSRVWVIDLARNFGHQSALTVGLDEAEGDAVILMDADMEDSPEDILQFLNKWDEGYQVVYAIRKSRKLPFFKALPFKIFHKINSKISKIDMPTAGSFSLMDRCVIEKMKMLREHNRYIPGLRSWVGFKQTGVELARGDRYDSKSRVGIGKLYGLALDSFISFSEGLLSFPFLFGLMLSCISCAALILVIIFKFIWNWAPWGWASLISSIFLIAGLQFAFIGLLGEYVTRILIEVKNRPLYITKSVYK